KGFLMCGYLNINAAETLGDTAAKVKGVQSFEDMLKAKVVEVTRFARELGIEPGMTGKEALEKMF
ncbi:MAG: YunC family protein, partial [Methanosarcina thermophila]